MKKRVLSLIAIIGFASTLVLSSCDNDEKPTINTSTTSINQKELQSITNISDISKIYDGNQVSQPTFDKLGDGKVTIEYKEQGESDNQYTEFAPKACGKYTVRISVEESATHQSGSNTKDFEITYAQEDIMEISLNPHLEFLIDVYGKVEAVNALNDEGNYLKGLVNFEGKTKVEAANLFVDTLNEAGYLETVSEKKVELKLSNGTELAGLKSTLENHLYEINVEATVNTKEITKDDIKNKLEEACKYYSESEINSMTEKELIEALAESRKETKSINSKELKDLYELARAISLSSAKTTYICELIGDDTNLKPIKDALINYPNTVKQAWDSFLPYYEETILNTSGFYMQYKNMCAKLKEKYLDALLDNNSELAKAYKDRLESLEKTLESSYDSIKLSINGILTQLNDINNNLDIFANQIKTLISENGGNLKKVYREAKTVFENELSESIASYNTDVWNLKGITTIGEVKYFYVDRDNNITYSFNEYKSKLSNTVYEVCYLYDGIYTKEQLKEKTPFDFYRYTSSTSTNITVTLDYVTYDSLYFEIDANNNIELLKAKGTVNYVLVMKSGSSTYTICCNSVGNDKIAYNVLGEHTKAEIESGNTHCMGAVGTWKVENGFVIISASGNEMKFEINEDGITLKTHIEQIDGATLKYSYSDNGYTYAFIEGTSQKIVYVYNGELEKSAIDIVDGNPIAGTDGSLVWTVENNIISFNMGSIVMKFSINADNSLSPYKESSSNNDFVYIFDLYGSLTYVFYNDYKCVVYKGKVEKEDLSTTSVQSFNCTWSDEMINGETILTVNMYGNEFYFKVLDDKTLQYLTEKPQKN